jgi:RecA-family ATPase
MVSAPDLILQGLLLKSGDLVSVLCGHCGDSHLYNYDRAEGDLIHRQAVCEPGSPNFEAEYRIKVGEIDWDDEREFEPSDEEPKPQFLSPALAAKSSKYPIFSVADFLELPEPDYLIADILVKGGLGLIYGQPGTYKSFFALDMAFCVATGRNFYGHSCKEGVVLYVLTEGRGFFGRRIEALSAHYQVPPAKNLYILPQAIDLPGANLSSEILNQGIRPNFIIVDTLARSFGGGDENATKDMNAFIRASERLQADFGATVLLIHHAGKSSERNERGNSALGGAVDTKIAIAKSKDNLITVTCEKQKDAAPFTKFELKPQMVGTSLVLKPTTAYEEFMNAPADSIVPKKKEGRPRPDPQAPPGPRFNRLESRGHQKHSRDERLHFQTECQGAESRRPGHFGGRNLPCCERQWVHGP